MKANTKAKQTVAVKSANKAVDTRKPNTVRRKEVALQYIKIASQLKRIPTLTDCAKNGLTQKTIRYHFDDSINKLRAAAKRFDTTKLLSKYRTNESMAYKILGVK